MGDIADEHQAWIADDMERLYSDPDYFEAGAYPTFGGSYYRSVARRKMAIAVVDDFDDLTEDDDDLTDMLG